MLVFSQQDSKWEIILKSGFESDIAEEIDVEQELLHMEEITTTPTIHNRDLQAFDIVIPVFHHNSALAFVLIGDIDEEQEGISPTIKHLHFIQTLTNIIMVAIENKRLFEESLRQEAIKKELVLASNIQSMLIPDPSHHPQNEKFYLDAFYLPHFEVGGDYYDYTRFNENEIGFCIADVSGKGISAAMLMSNFQANLKALFTPEISLTKLAHKLNELINRNARGQKFITLFLGKYNYETKTLNYVNCGHNPPLLYDKARKKLEYLKFGSIGLGMFDELPFVNEGEYIVTSGKTGTKLLCFTDGLIEIRGEEQIESGLKTIEKYFCSHYRVDESMHYILNEFNIQRQNHQFFDDISILGIEFY